jgi:hypothetical protein
LMAAAPDWQYFFERGGEGGLRGGCEGREGRGRGEEGEGRAV